MPYFRLILIYMRIMYIMLNSVLAADLKLLLLIEPVIDL